MAELSINESAPPASGRFQFRLRSMFVLMAIIALAFGLIPLWYRKVIVFEHLPIYLRNIKEGEVPFLGLPTIEDHLLRVDQYTPAFSLIAFVGCCGLWYAYAQPCGRKSDFWIGSAFACSLGFIVLPAVSSILLIAATEVLLIPFGNSVRNIGAISPVMLIVPGIYSFWPMLLRRYWAALLLFLYGCIYSLIVFVYGLDVVGSAIG